MSGAFHTSLMENAREKLGQFLYFTGKEKLTKFHVSLRWPRMTVYSNFQGKPYPGDRGKGLPHDRVYIPQWIIEQVTSPVKWEQIQQQLLKNVQIQKSDEPEVWTC